MDCAKNTGYNGIKYESSRHYIGDNNVLFQDFSDQLTPVESPVIQFFEKDPFYYPQNKYDDGLFEKLDI
ncbi:MAG TPA: hypothetical protein VIK55_17235 [Paludibacter sp.]